MNSTLDNAHLFVYHIYMETLATKRKNARDKTVTFRTTSAMAEALARLAANSGSTRSDVVCMLVAIALNGATE